MTRLHDHDDEVATYGRCLTCARATLPAPPPPASRGKTRAAATEAERVAAAQVKVGDQQAAVLAVLVTTETGATAHTIAEHLAISPNQIATRLQELRERGCAAWVPAERLDQPADNDGYLVAPTTPGNHGRVHVATEIGRWALVNWRIRNAADGA